MQKVSKSVGIAQKLHLWKLRFFEKNREKLSSYTKRQVKQFVLRRAREGNRNPPRNVFGYFFRFKKVSYDLQEIVHFSHSFCKCQDSKISKLLGFRPKAPPLEIAIF